MIVVFQASLTRYGSADVVKIGIFERKSKIFRGLESNLKERCGWEGKSNMKTLVIPYYTPNAVILDPVFYPHICFPTEMPTTPFILVILSDTAT